MMLLVAAAFGADCASPTTILDLNRAIQQAEAGAELMDETGLVRLSRGWFDPDDYARQTAPK